MVVEQADGAGEDGRAPMEADAGAAAEPLSEQPSSLTALELATATLLCSASSSSESAAPLAGGATSRYTSVCDREEWAFIWVEAMARRMLAVARHATTSASFLHGTQRMPTGSRLPTDGQAEELSP